MAKVVLIAPVPTHPSSTGASARVRHMAEGLRSLGHEVHFLHLQQSLRNDDRAMRRFWGDRLHVFRSFSPASFVGRGRRKLVRVAGKTFHLNLPVDTYFDAEAARYVHALLTTSGFDAAILSYVFYSRLFESMPPSVRKLIDTHDVFSDRFRLYRQHGQANEFFSTRTAEEKKGLDRADAVLAIQEWDAKHFRCLTTRPVAVVGHLAPVIEVGPPLVEASATGILFVGGPMGINVHGVTWFIDEVLPLVRRQVPEAELWLVGGISERIGGRPSNVQRLGFVDSVGDLYQRAAVVINPQRFGTGLSIKSVEALLHGRPLVTTVSGARGLEDGANVAFRMADSAEDFAGMLVELLSDPGLRAALAGRASEFAHAYYKRNLQALADVVTTSATR